MHSHKGKDIRISLHYIINQEDNLTSIIHSSYTKVLKKAWFNINNVYLCLVLINKLIKMYLYNIKKKEKTYIYKYRVKHVHGTYLYVIRFLFINKNW